MKLKTKHIGRLFLVSALCMLLAALLFGLLSATIYLFPAFMKESWGFNALRPMHVSAAMFWILLGATGCIYSSLQAITGKRQNTLSARIQWLLWLLAIAGIFYSYCNKQFGGREYWEFNPAWALPIAAAWLLFLVNFISTIRRMKDWPVYIWMWMTGIVFFMFTFMENYLWIFPYFRSHFITDMTIQWKVNGSLVGAWNQILYGTAFYLMDRMEGTYKTGRSKLAFTMYFLGLFNLMFNWGHHIYTLPTAHYIRYIGYAVSMTEWIFFIRIICTWRSSISAIQKNYHYFPYRFIMAADIWVFINMGQAILMSIPAVNIYTHGTHVTVAHAMGTTIGINSMILFAACFEFMSIRSNEPRKSLNFAFWLLQGALLVFWLSLNLAGLQKAIWQMGSHPVIYSKMMTSLAPYFITFFIAGVVLFLAFGILASQLIWNYLMKKR